MIEACCKPHAMGLGYPQSMGFAMIDFEQLEEHASRYREAFRIWDEPQFTVHDVCSLTGATPKAIEHFVDQSRNMVRLITREANPGKGRRRLFTGGQVLMIKAAYVMNAIGFPQKFSASMAEQVMHRATGLTNGLAIQTKMHLISYPMANGDWAAIPIYAETEEEPQLPVVVQVLDVDRLVAETRAQLEAIIEGKEVPDFAVPEIKPENPYSPASNFFRAWEKDDLGRWKRVGLTWEESEELLALEGARLDGDDLILIPAHKTPPEHRDRYLELHDRHEMARLDIVAGEIAARMMAEGD